MKGPAGVVLLSLATSLPSLKHPDCSGPDGWPTNMAFVHLKNAGITDNDKVDFTKIKTTRLASEHVGKDLYRQVHQVLFVQKSGAPIELITISDASHKERSRRSVDVFVVARHLGAPNKRTHLTRAARVTGATALAGDPQRYPGI